LLVTGRPESRGTGPDDRAAGISGTTARKRDPTSSILALHRIEGRTASARAAFFAFKADSLATV
jgi:hypothetical protein